MIASPTLNEPILILLFAIGVTLAILGCVGAMLPKPLTGAIASALSGAGAVLALGATISGGEAAILPLPPGLPGVSLSFTLDPTNAVFLFGGLLCGAAVAAAAAVAGRSPDVSAAIALTVAGLLLTMLADGAVPVAIGLAISWAGL